MKRFHSLVGGVLILILLLGMATAGYMRRYTWWNGRDDLKLGVLMDKEVLVVSVSADRRMVNVLRVEGETLVWIPRGFSWYRADRVKKLLESENRQDLAEEIFIYNFGLVPDQLIWLEEGRNWDGWKELSWSIGPINMLNLKSMEKTMLVKEETFTGSLKDNLVLDETLFRDFSDNRINGERLSVTLVNAAEMGGLATWLAARLEWSGMPVVALETADEMVRGCQLVVGDASMRKTKSYVFLRKIGDMCKEVESEYLEKGEMRLVIGSELAKMINYSSY